MELYLYLKVFFSLMFTLGIICLVAIIVNKWLKKDKKSNKYISVIESKIIDGRRRLILVRYRDSKEYLLLIGNNNELLLDSISLSKVTNEEIELKF